MNQGERNAAEEYQERKKREAQREKDIADAESWWVKNKEKFVKMDGGKCHEYLNHVEFNREVRPKVAHILFARLCDWKGEPGPHELPHVTISSGNVNRQGVFQPCTPCPPSCKNILKCVIQRH